MHIHKMFSGGVTSPSSKSRPTSRPDTAMIDRDEGSKNTPVSTVTRWHDHRSRGAVDQMERSRNEKLGQYVSRPLTATTGRDELLATKHDILGSEYRDLVIATTDRDDWLAMKKRKS
ncbi:hypothetical protein ACOSQ2_008155 [Xanthoceras sorbifolium]